MKKLFMIAVAALAGCVVGPKFDDPKPGQYPDYRALGYDRAKVYQLQGVPPALNRQVQVCMVDVTIEHMTPSELSHWDSYARAEIKVPQSEIDAYDREVSARLKKADMESEMRKSCPDTYAELMKYKA